MSYIVLYAPNESSNMLNLLVICQSLVGLCIVICVAVSKMADTEPTEKQIFRDHYSKLCNTMVDIDNLLPHFVQENIIQVDDLEEIKAKPRTTDKVEKLLQYISGPLQAGNVKSYHTLLSIMEEHGTQATRELASTMRNTSLAIFDVNISE